ncbi:hypothetical protein [Oricola indica]|jgi:hypothetical protein|uniref:hypothetical protein n=1 Tax=Oricola indica TaxID=2872591 RepID=UPI001CBE7842|nr:hypothetical protein [Oricola indica]
MNHIGLLPSQRQRDEMHKWLSTAFRFTHIVTLTTHDNTLSPEVLRSRLRAWDARVNRELYGPKWRKHADELLWYFAFLEKPNSNPHWHLLLRVVGRWGSDGSRDYKKLPLAVRDAWGAVMPSGTVDVQEIRAGTYKTVNEYVAKELAGAIQYEHFLTPDEFRRFSAP